MCSQAKRMKNEEPCNRIGWKLRPIISDDIFENVPQVEVIVDKIKNKKYISAIISLLNKIYPVTTLQHLKRVRGSEILINIAASDGTSASQRADIVEKLSTSEVFTLGLSLDPQILLVPAIPPRTKAQFESCNRVWPCNFHPDSNLEKTLAGENFTEADLTRIESWMRKCLVLCDYSGLACIIVDPDTDHLVASGVDERVDHPMKHAAMIAIDNVAKTQNGGAWNEDASSRGSGVSTSITKNTKEKLNETNTENVDITVSGPYLCTGYDVYLTAEPCLMCAMALVHSRARRIFYGCPNTECGALGSRLKLHTAPNLNHHYEVYSGVLESECLQAFARLRRDL